VLLAQQLAECIEDDSIADAEEEMKRSRNDALGWDSEQGTLVWMEGVTVSRSAIARGVEVVAVRDDADGTRVSGRGRSAGEGQHSPDVRKGSRVTNERSQSIGTAVL